MIIHQRFIFPVGQGGFACEMIGDYVVVYDCGSVTSNSMVESCIEHLSTITDHVDILFISHFDTDHVNSIRYLVNSVQVKKAVVSLIPQELKAAYGVYTNGAYTYIVGLLTGNDIEIIEVGGEEDSRHLIPYQNIWEWIAKSMMNKTDFASVKTHMEAAGIDINRLNDANYLEIEKVDINNAFKTVFGAKGPNTRGLIMLSQHCKKVKVRWAKILKGCRIGCMSHRMEAECDVSSCLYVGDADLKNRINNKIVQAFLDQNSTEKPLFMMQIPHHGSQYNIGAQFETDFPAKYYFVNDEDTKRLQKSACLFDSLMKQKKLLVSRGHCQDLIKSFAEI